MRLAGLWIATAALVLTPAAAQARNILITNDDGLTSNVVALYHALTEQGHDVIVSVPCQNQSGMGAALGRLAPIGALEENCLNDAAQAGEPGVGVMTRGDLPEGDFHYAAGTPVVAVLYGLDVLAQSRWGAGPDLVLSGPNEGQNVGSVILSSGTVSAAQTAAVRGYPAIALSAGSDTESATLDNPLSAQVARLSAQLVGVVDAQAGEGPLLPQGLALNVNFPENMEGAEWRISEIGDYNYYLLTFVEDLTAGRSPEVLAMMAERGVALSNLPGITAQLGQTDPTSEQRDDESYVFRSAISVSPMQAGYAYGGDQISIQLGALLGDLLETGEEPAKPE